MAKGAQIVREDQADRKLPSQVNQDLGQEGYGSQSHDLGSIIKVVTKRDTH